MTTPDIGRWNYTHQILNSVQGYLPRDEVRFLVQDTDPNVRLLSDDEVAYQIAQWIGTYTPTDFTQDPPVLGVWTGGPYDHPLMAARGCALRISAKFAGIVQISVDGVEVNVGDLMERYAAIAEALEDEYERISETGGDVDISNIMWGQTLDPSIVPTTFARGMTDNPLAGQQDYGDAYTQGYAGSYPGDGDVDVSVP